MNSIKATIITAGYLQSRSIRIGTGSEYFWVERFVQNCSTVALAQQVCDTLQEAIQAKNKWHCNCNDIVAEYNPSRQIVQVRHELDEIAVPPASALPVTDFLRILSAWLEAFPQQRPA